MHEKLESYYLNKEEPNRSCLLALRSIILQQDLDLTETFKYGAPCFCYKKKMVFYLWIDKIKEEPYILFVDGNLLDHPALEAGNRKRMKILRIDPRKDIQLNLVELLLNQALDLHRKQN